MKVSCRSTTSLNDDLNDQIDDLRPLLSANREQRAVERRAKLPLFVSIHACVWETSHQLLRFPSEVERDDSSHLERRIVFERPKHTEGLRRSYKAGSITVDSLTHLAKQSAYEDGPRRAKDVLSSWGIHLVCVSHLPKTYLDGAALRDVNGGAPVVALTLRYDRIDNFRFSLLHELAMSDATSTAKSRPSSTTSAFATRRRDTKTFAKAKRTSRPKRR